MEPLSRRAACARLLRIGLAPVAVAAAGVGSGRAVARQGGATPVAPVRGNDAPAPVTFPKDDGPHDTLVEWWYYTGHLFAPDRTLYGFEFVIFRGKQGRLEGAASHFAVTDSANEAFRFDQRIQTIDGVIGNRAAMDLSLDGWTMLGENGNDRLRAEMAEYGIDLRLSSRKPPVLHDGDGYIAYGDGTASYYYSRTRMAVEGRVKAGERVLPVTGQAWMDHQWGDFQTFKSGGWDWFAVQLDDGRELMLYLIRDLARDVVLVDGSLVGPNGELTMLGAADFDLRATGSWTSPTTGTTYPSGWTIRLPRQAVDLTITPTMPGQELDTRPTTGVVYWEGQARVSRASAGRPLGGLAYVELTGYAPVGPIAPPLVPPKL